MSSHHQPGKITVAIMKSENPRLEVPEKWVIYRVGWPRASVTHAFGSWENKHFKWGRITVDRRRVMGEEIHYYLYCHSVNLKINMPKL